MDGATSLIGQVSVDTVLGPASRGPGISYKGSPPRVRDLEGKQVVDLVAFNAADPHERQSTKISSLFNGNISLSSPSPLFSNRCNRFLHIGVETGGPHNLLAARRHGIP